MISKLCERLLSLSMKNIQTQTQITITTIYSPEWLKLEIQTILKAGEDREQVELLYIRAGNK